MLSSLLFVLESSLSPLEEQTEILTSLNTIMKRLFGSSSHLVCTHMILEPGWIRNDLHILQFHIRDVLQRNYLLINGTPLDHELSNLGY